ncbi:MAG: BofC C-terminal domain-containing protein [Lachnospiraceae bacterium]
MKRAYMICLLFLCAGIVFYLSFFYSREHLGLEYEEYATQEETIPVEQMTQAGINDIRINNLTTVKLQVYDLGENEFEEKKINTPVEFLEMTRKDLIEYLKNYMLSPSKEDTEKGLLSYELVEFARGQVVLRKTYQKPEEPVEVVPFIAMAENGYVAIYYSEDGSLYDYTEISVNQLPEGVQKNLEDGIGFANEQELYEFLETYTS